MWSSSKRTIEHVEEVDAKGGPVAENTTFTYEQDWLCWAPINAIGFSRIWVNGSLRYSVLADTSDETFEASQEATNWGSVTFLDGNSAQMPWAPYEAAVGTANAQGFRGRPANGSGSLNGGSHEPDNLSGHSRTGCPDKRTGHTPPLGGGPSGVRPPWRPLSARCQS